ncbi:PMT-domain-containing protein [Ascodesmis nigricans]|uniref:dolichyl-phosphate-mannose--protein mannosyltransferase n=1 Tax=Ascodesmis nigricans TaxID=341454 RepID=A0A4S2MR18_9PEZI|nr:PMT-domain-containing protein [Ascodesmis nigricans]
MARSKSAARLGVDHTADRRRSPSPSPSRKKRKAPSPGPRPLTPTGKEKHTPEPAVKDNDIFNLPSSDYNVLFFLIVLAVGVRLFRIYQPSSVVFDEVHFGGFATKYIKGKFFMDVHPPLAKLLITLAGWLAGFDGSFDFKEIGLDYLEPRVPYVAMRMLPAVCGILTIPLMFLTAKAMGTSTASAALAAGLVIFDNALVTQSRLILLDSPLVVFTAFTGLAWACFLNLHEQGPKKAFGANWWFWLAMTGLGLGATASVKWVGLFTIAWVGVLTVWQLWTLLGDTVNVTPRIWVKHFYARAVCLIGIPIAFYMGMFVIHFICLVNPGEGDGFMSAEFVSTLNGKGMKNVAADVAFGSKITIKHHNTQGGYLHSHNHMYPTGSLQQQVTLYPHRDINNDWVIENTTAPAGGVGIGGFDAINPPIWVQDGSIIKLYHTATDRRLHSHDHRPPVSDADWQNEVSAYGYTGFEGDANDYFRVEIVKSLSDGVEAKKRLRTIQTKFRLIHTLTGCVLFSHKVKLPAWGFEQQEVTCAKGGTVPNSIWYIESNSHVQLGADAEKVNYKKPGFFGKFWELQKVMWRTNAGLVESHAWDSRPDSWPLLKRGINFWGKDHRQIYLIGNPLIWWTSTAVIGVYAVFKILAILRWQRGYGDYAVENFRRFDYEVGVAVLGWALHYFPFFLMQRQLFLHHYLPALYFAILALSQTFDFVAFRIKAFGVKKIPALGWTLAILFLTASALVFTLYSPLAYGNPWTKAQCKQVKLFDKWDWDCNTFLNNIDDYKKIVPSAKRSPSAASPPPQPLVAPNQQPIVAEKPKEETTLRADTKIEEIVEYRDQNGNILNEAQVKALEGKVEFETKYETRYRVVDEFGNEIESSDQPIVDQNAPVPEEPEAVEPETPGAEEPVVAAPENVEAEAEPQTEPAKEPEPEEAAPAEGAEPVDETPKVEAEAEAEIHDEQVEQDVEDVESVQEPEITAMETEEDPVNSVDNSSDSDSDEPLVVETDPETITSTATVTETLSNDSEEEETSTPEVWEKDSAEL